MRFFDHIEPVNLERRQWHLWTLSLTVMTVLFVGMGLLMYPTVFGHPVVLSSLTARTVFFAFCSLAILLLGYLVDRQIVITQLRKKLELERETIVRIRHEASADLLGTLPGLDHFRDRLAMEYRRASNTRQPLSLLVVELKPARNIDHSEAATAFGDAAKAITRKLRGEDSIYLFGPGVFGIVLPGVSTKNAFQVADRLTDGLHDASGASNRFSFEVRAFNFPEHAATAREMEEAVRQFMVQPVKSEPSATTTEKSTVLQ